MVCAFQNHQCMFNANQVLPLKWGLAMLLERVSCFIFKVNFQKFFLFYLWVMLCFKVGDNSADMDREVVW